ncbi:hypothetical protein FSP39_012984 [Pinctada imbricata]|uniref:G-protein coupled receptors family 2 profile 2 domain-containing protein n=1 Tax=Pinctada imbricata TaxID=66713 RepID=A0AA88XS10_PINIB|nr:hypothetical protein FSP39_012984 [Pinctada imbricata]
MSRPVEKTDCKIHPTQQFLDFSISLENKLSIASSAVSVVTLVPSIIFCTKCPLYHNLPGRNSLSLMINLFIAHVLFLSGVPLKSKSMECVVIGILLHWSWLAVFVWMSVCSFHTWFTFSMYGFVKLKYANDKRMAFRAYNVIGYGVPSLITGVCVALHFLCPTCKFNYGTVSCFISNPTMLGVAFAAPCGFLLIMNMIFFAMMIRNVQNLPRIRTNELSMNRNNIVVYLKLSLLIGFTWILSFVSEIVQLKWVLYLSILINGSQGLHLFWSHVCNKRAIDYLRVGSLSNDKSSDHDTESTTTRHKTTKL